MEIEVSPHCLACGEDPDGTTRCHPDPARLEKLQWFREQPSFELRENIGSGHIVAVRRDKPTIVEPMTDTQTPAQGFSCSFCSKPQKDVKKLIVGPGAYICDECVELCAEIISEESSSPAGSGLEK